MSAKPWSEQRGGHQHEYRRADDREGHAVEVVRQVSGPVRLSGAKRLDILLKPLDQIQAERGAGVPEPRLSAAMRPVLRWVNTTTTRTTIR